MSRVKIDYGINPKFLISNQFWEEIKDELPLPKEKKISGRPRMDDRRAMNGILYVARTGCQWNAMPRSIGASSTIHDRFQEWAKDGVFERLWKKGLLKYDEKKRLGLGMAKC